MDQCGARAFAHMSRQPSPTLADTLLAVSAALRPVDHAGVDTALDELALELFAVEPTAQARAGELATLLVRTFGPDAGTVADLHVEDVLDTRHGHALLVAATAAELGRRAGWTTFVCSSPGSWYTGLREEDRLWLIDPTGDSAEVPTAVRRHCGHELAFALLSGLAARSTCPHEVCQVLELRSRLDVDPGAMLR